MLESFFPPHTDLEKLNGLRDSIRGEPVELKLVFYKLLAYGLDTARIADDLQRTQKEIRKHILRMSYLYRRAISASN